MKSAYLFFISLCFLLLEGNNYAQAGVHINKAHLQVNHSHRAKNIKSFVDSENHTQYKGATVSEEKEYLITDEDDDEHDLSAGKYNLLAKSCLLFAYTLFLGYLYNSLKDRLPLCNHLSYINSYKYLSQRVLRI
jgi:hypothetical protein